MFNMKVNIFSQNEILINISDNQVYLNNEIKTLKIDNSFILYCYPLGKFENEIAIPYCAKVELENNCFNTNCENLEIINFPDFTEITINILKIKKSSASCLINSFEFIHNQTNYTVEIYGFCENNFIIKNSSLIFKSTIKDVRECTIFKLGSFIIIYYQNLNQNILIFDISNNKIVFDRQILQFEIDKSASTLSVVTKINDSLSHGEVFVFELLSSLVTKQNYLIYTNDENILNAKFDEFVFFDCVKAKNFKKARSYLSQSLQNVLTDDLLFDYFNDYKDIRAGENENEFFLIPNKKICKAEYFIFEKENNLIKNIKRLDKNNKI